MKQHMTAGSIIACLLVHFLFFTSAFAQSDSSINPYHYSISKVANGNHGAVSSAHPLASMVGLSILKRGGNAFDAAIAVQLALAVVFPNAGNLGGGGFLVAHTQSGKSVAIDFREKAPGSASRDMYLDSLGNPVNGLSQDGHLSSGVPGTVAGLFSTLKYALLPFQDLVQPSIELAERGFAITESEAETLNNHQDDFHKYSIASNVFIKKEVWKAGDTLIQKELAATLIRLREHGMKDFYQGETARLIVEEMKRGNGKISMQDLASYNAIERTALTFKYKGHQIIGMPMPSSGALLMLQIMKMVEDRGIGKMGFQSKEAVQLMIEAERRAYADRAEYMGDADFLKVPVKQLSDRRYIKDRMEDYVPGKATPSKIVNPGNINPESEETTHLSIADLHGNAVSVTTTLNGLYGSRTVVGGAGFLLNNQMDDFSIKPGVPNIYGAVGKEANAIAPGKRMLSSMSPTIVLKNKKPFLVVGTPGGTTIPTTVFQTIINIIEFNQPASDAVNNTKFHHQWLPDQVMVEEDIPAELVNSLHAMGYTTKTTSQIGRTELIKISWRGKKRASFEAIADKRGDDHAAAF
jgi:gamma-glutamyltranspeptidase/glutathione hydrolase